MQRVVNAIKDGIFKGVNEPVALGENLNCRRLFHGRGHCYSDLEFINVDWYYPAIVITLYQALESAAWEQLLSGVAILNDGSNCLLVQQRYLHGAPTHIVWGQLPEHMYAFEHGMKFRLTFIAKQNTGFFLDMSPGRQWLRENAQNKNVLNLFSYTCSLSVAAICGGASNVVNVDMSRAALTIGRENHQLNKQSSMLKRNIHFMPYDIFRSWKAITHKGPYDLVVIDPPSRQKGSFIATKDYSKVVRRLTSLMSNGGDVLLCLNAPELGESFLHNIMATHCPTAKKIARLSNREDFPEINSQRNVKMIHYQLP